jgi:hypothetical protein
MSELTQGERIIKLIDADDRHDGFGKIANTSIMPIVFISPFIRPGYQGP